MKDVPLIPRPWVISQHARHEMARRQISIQDVERLLEEPEQCLPLGPGRVVAQSRVAFGEPPANYLVRIFVDIDRVPAVVVTVYRTSKMSKYWREP